VAITVLWLLAFLIVWWKDKKVRDSINPTM